MNTVETPVPTRFETPDAIALVVRSAGGLVRIRSEETDHTTVVLTALDAAGEEALRTAVVEQRDDTVLVDVTVGRGLFREGPSVRVEVTCPLASTLEVHTESAPVEAVGTFAAAAVASGSGGATLEAVTGDARLRSGSGTVHVGSVGQDLTVRTGSGEVYLGRTGREGTVTAGSGDVAVLELIGELVASTGSGDVTVDRLAGSLVTKTGSGDLTVRRATSGSVRATAASGEVSVGVAEGTAAWLDLSTVSGRVRQELGESEAPTEGQSTLELTARSVSGDLRVHRS